MRIGFSFLTTQPDIENAEVNRQEERIREETRLEGDIDHLRLQRERLEVERAGKELPRAMYWAVGALAYMTAAGIVVPTATMAWRPVATSLVSRRIAFGLFVSGLLTVHV